ncbi:MAG TPA: polysaccharide biosynthesis tyrosine autokinase [Verrucomicrobiae bacterium]|jgi:capsular exopolysaccharide synthesis family protein
MDSATTTDSPEVKLHFLDYWRVIRLRRSLILVVFLLCVMTSTLLTIWLPKKYASTVRIEVQKDTPEVSMLHPQAQYLGGSDPYFLTTQFKIIESYSILTNVIADLHLDVELPKQLDLPQWTMDETYTYLNKMINVEQTRMTSLIEITVKNPSPRMAADIANKIAYWYKESRKEQWRETHNGGIYSYQTNLAAKEAQLLVMQKQLDKMRVDMGVTELASQGPNGETTESKDLLIWTEREVVTRADYLEYSNVLYGLKQIPNDKLGVELSTAYSRITDSELGEKSIHLSYAKEQMTAIKDEYGKENPRYKTAEQQLIQAQEDYDNKVSGIVAGVEARVDQLSKLLQVIVQNEDEIRAKKNTQDEKFRPYYQLKDSVDNLRFNNRESERYLNQEIAEAAQPDSGIVIVRDPGRPDQRPVSPKTMIIVPLGVIVGLIVGIGLAFFIEYLDTSVKTIDDVERALQAPVLGVIPQNVGILLEEGPDSPHGEAYRVLRTNILFSRKNEKWNTMTVLSGGAGEGKSTTLFNLATVFAQNGQRVLVVDSDLRRPTLHRALHVSNTIGITDYLLKKNTMDEVIQKTKVPTMDFIASGKLPNSSMSILGSGQLKETIQELKRRYDFIFFDSPPLLGVSDASILASEMDMVLQVVQYRRYPQAMTLRAKQMILKVGGNLVGIVLNNINMSQDENYYYYSGYYEYQSHSKDQNVVQVADAAKPAKVEVKPKY